LSSKAIKQLNRNNIQRLFSYELKEAYSEKINHGIKKERIEQVVKISFHLIEVLDQALLPKLENLI